MTAQPAQRPPDPEWMTPTDELVEQLKQINPSWRPRGRRNGHQRPNGVPVATTVAPSGDLGRIKAWAEKGIAAELASLEAAPRGTRNSTLNDVALRCLRLILLLESLGLQTMSREELRRELIARCDRNGLNADDGLHDTEGTIESAFRAADRDGPADPPEPSEYAPDVQVVTETELLAGQRWEPPPGDARLDQAAECDDLEAVIADRMRVLRVNREANRRLDAEERPQAVAPPVRGLTKLLAEPDNPVRYRIADLAPEGGRGLLSAQYKAGKTTIVGNLARSLVDGEPFLGRFAVDNPARSVVLIDTEMSEATLRRWLADQRITNTSAITDVIALRGRVSAFNLLDDRCRAQWAARLASIGCDYLILDCLRPVLDSLGLDENHDAGRFLVAFDALLAEAGINNALIVQHMGHVNERARGDSRLQDWPDVIWRLVRETDQPDSARFFTAHGRDVDVAEGRLNFDPITRRLSYVNGSRGDAKTEAAKTAAVELLTESAEPLSQRAIERALDGEHALKTVRAGLALAVRHGLVMVTSGPYGAKLHSIAHPCSECGLPVAAGQQSHESCRPGSEV